MDPAARRFVWDLLQRNRKSRAIVLTTRTVSPIAVPRFLMRFSLRLYGRSRPARRSYCYHIERKASLCRKFPLPEVQGNHTHIFYTMLMPCCLSLSQFGIGYVLTMVKTQGCSVQAVEHFVKEHVPSAKFLSHVAQELAFRLPRWTPSLVCYPKLINFSLAYTQKHFG